MRKASVLLVGVFALMFVAGVSPLMANSDWSGTGTGVWVPDSSTTIYPFQNWQGTINTGVSPNVFSGTWSDTLGNSGSFICRNWLGVYYFTGTWRWSELDRDAGNCFMYFNFNVDTCGGTWSGPSNGTWSGTKD